MTAPALPPSLRAMCAGQPPSFQSILYRAENLRIVQVFGPAALAVSPASATSM